MSRPILALDVDDVLVPHIHLLLSHYNRLHGRDVAMDDFWSNELLVDMQRIFGDDSETVKRNMERYFRTKEFMRTAPMEGAKESLAELSRHYDMVVVSARNESLHRHTEEWLEEHFPGSFKHIEFTNYKPWGHENKTPKVSILKQLGAEVFVDDMPHQVSRAAEGGLRAVLFGDYPWNRAAGLPAGAMRARDWQAVANVLAPVTV